MNLFKKINKYVNITKKLIERSTITFDIKRTKTQLVKITMSNPIFLVVLLPKQRENKCNLM